MAQLARHPLQCQGFRGVIWSILGDKEFFSNTLLLPHWAGHFPCGNCDCQNFAESEEGKHVKEIRMDKQKLNLVTHAEALKKSHETHAKKLCKIGMVLECCIVPISLPKGMPQFGKGFSQIQACQQLDCSTEVSPVENEIALQLLGWEGLVLKKVNR